MLLATGMAAIYFSEHLGYGGAGPLGAVVTAFVSLVFWTKQGWDIENNPASTAFGIFWMIVEPVNYTVKPKMSRKLLLYCFLKGAVWYYRCSDAIRRASWCCCSNWNWNSSIGSDSTDTYNFSDRHWMRTEFEGKTVLCYSLDAQSNGAGNL